MGRFHNHLTYSSFYLCNAQGILITSFCSHKTISHLDLQARKSNFRLQRQLQKRFFYSEENMRNHLVPERRLLYTLNLDIPDGREYSNIRDGPTTASLTPNCDSLFVTLLISEFYETTLCMLIQPALELTKSKLKLLKWVADFRPLDAVSEHNNVSYSLAKVLYLESEDSELAMKVFDKCIRIRTFVPTGDANVFEYFLRHAKLCGFDLRRKKTFHNSYLVDQCIDEMGFQLVHSVLKYEDTVDYTDEAYEGFKEIVRKSRQITTEEHMRRPENHTSKSRLYRILQLYKIFLLYSIILFYKDIFNPAEAPEAIRVIWRSIPDCFVSLQEMMEAYKHVIKPANLTDAHRLYEEAIGQTVSCREPRSLSQYCRTVIRKSLYNSKQWLPDGIKQLNLPPRFKPFLNLETDNLLPISQTN